MEGTSINLLLIAVAITALFKMVVGYKRGMVKEIISLVSLVVERPMNASTAWVRASIPVEAVRRGGRERVISGSSTA